MAPGRGARLQSTLLDALIRATEWVPARGLAARLSRNQPPAPRAEVVAAVSRAVSTHYHHHRIEAELAARQACTYQRVWFRHRVREFRSLAESAPDDPRRPRWEELANYFRAASQRLQDCGDADAVIAHLATYYVQDMAADLNPAFFLTFKQVARRLFPCFVDSIRASETEPGVFDRLRELDGTAPLVYVPNHVSNADHIPICFALNSLGLRQPKIAAGANLFRGTSTRILPRVNVYKIRREHIGDGSSWLNNIRWFQNPIYRRTHAEYLRYGWDHNEDLLFYLEGTRSRDGTIGRAKLGILAEAFEYATETARTLYAVPVSIAYTVVPEDRDIESSRSGKNISHTDLVAQLTALDRSYRTYAEVPIHVRLGPPTPLDADSGGVDKMGADLLKQVKAGVVLTDTSVAAACLLAVAIREEAPPTCRIADLLAHWRERYGGAAEFSEGTLPSRVENALRTLALRGFLAPTDDRQTLLLLDEPLLRQYANRIIHHPGRSRRAG
ncbi:MAG: 1-acyl-sn-glycerol-3-phosphate acyltransferase [Deferrisomatales bacterium]|nr:1-acyl-sn-glycerol-3-phosphate acyltransferase [Deferrisomatales bacterium]